MRLPVAACKSTSSACAGRFSVPFLHQTATSAVGSLCWSHATRAFRPPLRRHPLIGKNPPLPPRPCCHTALDDSSSLTRPKVRARGMCRRRGAWLRRKESFTDGFYQSSINPARRIVYCQTAPETFHHPPLHRPRSSQASQASQASPESSRCSTAALPRPPVSCMLLSQVWTTDGTRGIYCSPRLACTRVCLEQPHYF